MKNDPLKMADCSQACKGPALQLPLFLTGVQAGFPSPADDYIEKRLDLNELVIQHPTATFFVRVVGDSMNGANMHSGDILVVDRSIEPSNGRVIVAVINGEFTVKRMTVKEQKIILIPENPAYPSIPITPECDFQVWGVVTYVIHKLCTY